MSRAVVCKSIDGYEIYKPLASAAQTSDEKLLIYYRPLRYKIDFVDGYYRAHLVQDNEVRKRGRKEVVRQKKKVVEYDPKSKDPLGPIYIRNTISLKGLEPGDYELTIILRDERDKGGSALQAGGEVQGHPAPRHEDQAGPAQGRRPAPGIVNRGRAWRFLSHSGGTKAVSCPGRQAAGCAGLGSCALGSKRRSSSTPPTSSSPPEVAGTALR